MINWEFLLGTEDVEGELRRLYASMPLNVLADHLGVSASALRRALRKHGIPLRTRGGPHYKFPREELPENVKDMTPEQVSELTGYSVTYSRKLLRQWREDEG